jgi:dTDP-4-amino-4,6-dideoxygalactose transaminase
MTDQKQVPIRVDWSGIGERYTEEDIAYVAELMRNTITTFTQGPLQSEFEKAFCEFTGAKHTFAVNSCTSALELAATICELKAGDEVIIPNHTYCASAIPFGRTRATLVWADCDPDTWVVTAETLSKKITAKTKVIVVVHLYGLACDMPPIMDLAKKHNLIVIEDCAQALGASSNGHQVGTFGDFGCYSFHTHKNITTLGEGGALTVKNDNHAALLPGLRHNGHQQFAGPRDKYWVPAMVNVDQTPIEGVWPLNYCMGEVQCGLATQLLKRVHAISARRKKCAERFKAELSQYPELIFQAQPKDQQSVFHLLPARYDGSKTGKTNHDFIGRISSHYGVKAIVQYYPLNRYPLFEKFGFGKADCPNTDFFFDNMISFPFHSWMPEDQFTYMIDSAKRTLDDLRG